jgi:hypothetical protein
MLYQFRKLNQWKHGAPPVNPIVPIFPAACLVFSC